MKIIFTICLLFPLLCFAQFTDNFSDGDFTQNPEWIGDTDKFIVNTSHELQLNSEAVAGEAYLSTSSKSTVNASWEFLVRMGFNPSSNNYCNVYLMSNYSDLNAATNGYFVKLGNTQDEVSLYRRDPTGEVKIIDGIDKRLNMSSVTVRVRVTRDIDGNWSLMSDTLGGTDYFVEGNTFDNAYTETSYFGVYCKYTQTNSKKFHFDDFNVTGDFIEDVEPPKVSGFSIPSLSEINIIFSEVTDKETSLDINNYYLSPDFGNPIGAFSNPDEPNSVLIQFASSFNRNKVYELTIKNIKDLSGNILVDYILTITFTKEYDVIISEIMARPEPVVLLPNVKYIELYNRMNYDIDISSWSISLGNANPRKLPEYILPSRSYVVLCNQNNATLFANIDNVLGVNSFPSLTTTSGTLTLRDDNNGIIHTVNYDDLWYKNSFKKEGGYSLEIIDLNNPCEGIENWIASNDISGGTPGKTNSVNSINPDTKNPYPYAAEIIHPDTLVVYFNETLKSDYAKDINNFKVNEFGNPTWINVKEPDFSVISMKFNSEFKRGYIYYLEVSDSVKDCSGNMVVENTNIRFALADSITRNDIVINEILFNPYTGSKDFVELYNRSDKVLDLKLLWLSNGDSEGKLNNSVQIASISRLLTSGEYCAISTDIQDLRDNYNALYPNNLYQAKSIPSMPNDRGNIVLTDRYLNVIDEVNYDKDQHYKLLSTQNGVSLERINFNRSSEDLSNWHSASQSSGFATPGYINSQYSPDVMSKSAITISPQAFSPDNDGFDDRLTISYKLEEPGYTATISIYGANGNFITHIINNEMLGTEGHVFWDGFDENNSLCPMGIYILYVEMFNLNGKKIKEKHAIVLSNKR
jgi:hypothetical protein